MPHDLNRLSDANIGYRVAMDRLLSDVFADLYARFEGGAEAFEAVVQNSLTVMHGVGNIGILPVHDADYAKHHATETISRFQKVANEIRKRRGEPTSRPA